MMKHRGHSGTTSVLESMWKEQYKREYRRKNYNDERLRDIKSSLKSYGPRETYNKKKEYELRVIAINELLDDS